MSILLDTALFLLKEHLHKPISGNLLLLGRQTVHLSVDQAVALVRKTIGSIRAEARIEVDRSTNASSGYDFITDTSFFSLFSDARVDCMDVSAYEGAEIIHNLNLAVPNELFGRYDFIFDGSCLDNIFNASQAMVNISKMLKVGGRAHIGENANINGFNEYGVFSPDWYYDFFIVNRYADCRVYIEEYDIDRIVPDIISSINSIKNFTIYTWKPTYINPRGISRYAASQLTPRRKTCVLTIAEKGAASSDDAMPIQSHYRSDQQHKEYIDGAKAFLSSGRPVAVWGKVPNDPELQHGPGENLFLCGFLKNLSASDYLDNSEPESFE